jgi:hypothetical protein
LLSGCLRFWFKGRCGVTLKGGLLLWLKPPISKREGKCQGFCDIFLIQLKIKTAIKKTLQNPQGLTLTERWRKLSLIKPEF